MNRIWSTVFLWRVFYWLSDFLVSDLIHLNVGYNYNIFFCHGGKERVRKQPSYISPSYFTGLIQTLYFFMIPRYMSWFFSNILNWRDHAIAKLLTEDLMSAVVSCVARKEVEAMEWVVSLSHTGGRGVKFP